MSDLVMVLIGLAVGVVFTGLFAKAMMRSKMVVPERSAHSFDKTCARVERTVEEAEGWSFPMDSFDMSAKLAEKDALPGNVKRIKQYFVCSPPVARRVLGDSPHLSAIMPCTWAVYETSDGSVWLSKMNIPMMSRVMGGVVGQAMGLVGRTETEFMKKVLS